MLEYVVHHFVYIHRPEVGIRVEPFRQGPEALERFGPIVGCDDVLFLRERHNCPTVVYAERVRKGAKHRGALHGTRSGVSVCYAHSFETPEAAYLAVPKVKVLQKLDVIDSNVVY